MIFVDPAPTPRQGISSPAIQVKKRKLGSYIAKFALFDLY